MSGLAGVRWLDDERRARPEDVRASLGALKHRGPDGLFAAASGPCALGFAQMVTTPEARLEEQPFSSAAGLVVTLDGRVDNRADLCAALGLRNTVTLSDAALVAAAWERWNTDALAAMLGDFALAVWSGRERRLWLARDVFGIRPLFYRQYRGAWWWASELQALARLGEAQVNEGMVGEYLADAITSETDTLVRGILRVPRASVLLVDPNGAAQQRRYWSPAVAAPRRYQDDADAVEEFRAVFAPAVRARARSDRPIVVGLSGGLDSSLIAAELSVLQHAGASPPVEAFTLAFPGHRADESSFAAAAARRLGIPHTLFAVGAASLRPIVDDAERSLDLPQTPNFVAGEAMNQALSVRGRRVFVSGIGANEFFSGHQFTFADQLRRFEFVPMIRRMRAIRGDFPSYRPWADLRLACWLQLPEGAKVRIRRALGWSRVPHWISHDLANRVSLADRLRARTSLPNFPRHQQRVMFEWATSADKVFFTEYAERLNAAVPCEERTPFQDRRVVEWALQLPNEQRWRDGVGKVVLRNAAVPVLPDTVVSRGLGPDFSFQVSDGLHAIGGRDLVMAIAGARTDWVDVSGVAQLWRSMVLGEQGRGDRMGYYAWVLWLLVATHFAAAAIERGGGASGDAALDAHVVSTTMSGSLFSR